MFEQALSALLAALSFLAMALLSRKHWSGWVVGLCSQGLLCYLTWGLWGITLLCLANACLYSWSAVAWWRHAV